MNENNEKKLCAHQGLHSKHQHKLLSTGTLHIAFVHLVPVEKHRDDEIKREENVTNHVRIFFNLNQSFNSFLWSFVELILLFAFWNIFSYFLNILICEIRFNCNLIRIITIIMTGATLIYFIVQKLQNQQNDRARYPIEAERTTHLILICSDHYCRLAFIWALNATVSSCM